MQLDSKLRLLTYIVGNTRLERQRWQLGMASLDIRYHLADVTQNRPSLFVPVAQVTCLGVMPNW